MPSPSSSLCYNKFEICPKNSTRVKEKKQFLKLSFLVAATVIVGTFFLGTHQVQAAVRTWDGGGTDGTCGGGAGDGNKWSCAANWSTDTLPDASDIATFDGTSTKNATIDSGFAGSVAGIDINSGYTGTITQARTLTIGTSNFDQAAGTFTGASQSITISGSFILSGGTFTSTSGNLTISSNITISGSPTFNHNSGTIVIDGFLTTSTLACNSVSFNLVTISKVNGAGGNVTVGADCTLPLGASPTSDIGSFTLTNNGTITVASGVWTILGSYTQSTGTLTHSGTGISLSNNLTLTGGSFTSNLNLTLNGFLTNSALSCNSVSFNLVTISKTVGAGGNVTVGSNCTLPLGNSPTSELGSFLLTNNGTITTGTGTWTINGSYTQNGGSTLTMGGTGLTLTNNLTINGGSFPSGLNLTLIGFLTNSALACNSVSFNLVTISKTVGAGGNVTVGADCTLPLGNSPTSELGSFLLTNNGTITTGTGTWTINGSYTQNVGSTLTMGGTGLTLTDNLTINGGSFPSGLNLTLNGFLTNSALVCNSVSFNLVTISKSVGGGGGVTVGADCTLPLGNSPTSELGGFTLTNNGTITTGTGTWTISSGSYTQNGGSTLTMVGTTMVVVNSLTLNGGIFPAGLNTLSVGGNLTNSTNLLPNGIALTLNTDTGTINCGTASFSSIVLSKTVGITFASDCTTTGSFTRTAGIINNPGSARSLFIGGDLAISAIDAFGGANLTVELNGTGTQNISNNTPAVFASPFRVNKASGTASLSTNFTVTGQTCTVVEGVFDINGKTFTCATGFTVEDGGTLQLVGSETPTTPTLNSGSTVSYKGDGDTLADTYTVTTLTPNYHHLTINSTDGATDVFQLGAAVDINGNFTLTAGTFNITGGNHQINVAGNWSKTGTFNPSSGTVVFDGTSQSISGSTSFFNFSKSVASSDTLTFAAGSTQSIAGTWTLSGANNNLLALRSSSTPTQWNVSPTGTRALSYLDVQDSNNTSGLAITTLGTNINDSGNNTGWTFNTTPFTWDGGGLDNNWSSCDNWTNETCPGAGNIAIFDTTSTKNSTIDGSFAGTLNGLDINTGYVGTITQARSLTISGGNFDQADGTFVGATQAIDINSSFILSGGTFTATTGSFTIQSNLTISGSPTFNHNSGTVTIDGGSFTPSVLSCNNVTFNLVAISKGAPSDGRTVTVGSNCTLPLGASPSAVAETLINNGTITVASGTLTLSGAYTQNIGATLTTTAFTLSRDLTFNGGTSFAGIITTFNGVSFADSSTLTCSGTFGGTVVIAKNTSDASFTLAAGCTVEVTSISGTIKDIIINGTMNHTGSTFDVNGDACCATGGLIINPGGVVTYTGTDISIERDFTQNGTFNLTGKTITFDGASSADNSTVTCTGSLGGTVILNKSVNGNDATFTLVSGCTITVDSISGVIKDIIINGTMNHTGSTFDVNGDACCATGGLYINSGAVVTYTGTDITIERDFTQNGTFDLTGKTITFDGAASTDNATLICGAPIAGDIVINKTNSNTFVLNSNCTVGGNFTRTDGIVSNSSSPYTLSIGGNLSISTADAFGGGNLTVELNGTGTQTVANNTPATFSSPFQVNKVSGTASLATNLIVTSATCTVVEGIFDLNTRNFTCATGFTVQDGGTLKLVGSETATTPTLNSGSTVFYKGDGDSAIDSYASKNWGYYHLTLNATDGTDDTFALPAALDVNGNLNLTSGTLDVTASNFGITLAGDWNRGGVSSSFNPRSGTVTLDGSSQDIIGSTTFNNLTKNVSSPDTLSFEAGSTQTISGTVDLQGISGNLLSLRSSSTPTQWDIDPQVTLALQYLDVQDSNNISGAAIPTVGLNITDSGNNTGWDFNLAPDGPSVLGPASYVNGSWTNDSTPTLTFLLFDNDADQVQYQIQIDDTVGFASPVIDYTSALGAQGANSFTVGQLDSGGSYAVGIAGQTLADSATYYWRLKAIDEFGGESSFVAANSGAVAFKIDTVAPTVGTLSVGSPTASSLTASVPSAGDVASGLAAAPFNFFNLTASTSSGSQAGGSWVSSGLSPSTSYTFEAIVSDAAGNTTTTNQASAATSAAPTPPGGGGGSTGGGHIPPPTPGPGPAPANQRPIGYLDGVNIISKYVFGWSQDPDNTSIPNQVHLYFDKNAGTTGASPVPCNASDFRIDVGTHAFNCPVPANLQDGRRHRVWAWGIDLTNPISNNAQLIGSPKSFTIGTITNPTQCDNVVTDADAIFRAAMIRAKDIYEATMRVAKDQQLAHIISNQQYQDIHQQASDIWHAAKAAARAARNNKILTQCIPPPAIIPVEPPIPIPTPPPLPPSDQTTPPVVLPPIVAPPVTTPPNVDPSVPPTTTPPDGGTSVPPVTSPPDGGTSAPPSTSPPPGSVDDTPGSNPPGGSTNPPSGINGNSNSTSSALGSAEQIFGQLFASIEGSLADLQLLAQAAAKYLPLSEEGLKQLSHVANTVTPALMAAVIYVPETAGVTGGLGMSDAGLIVYRWILNLLSFLGLRKKRRYWGTVYDSVTKQPLDPAIIKLVNVTTNKAVETAITDMTGRYGFLVRPGRFFIYPQKTHYRFPSERETGSSDLVFDNLYHGSFIDIVGESDVLTPNIPMDPVAFDWNQQDKQRVVKFHVHRDYALYIIGRILFFFGVAFALLIFFLEPSLLNGVFLALYAGVAASWALIPRRRLWGQLLRRDSGQIVTPAAGLYLELRQTNLPVVFGRAVVGPDGKFFLRAPSRGHYNLTVRQSKDSPILHEQVVRTGKDGVVNLSLTI